MVKESTIVQAILTRLNKFTWTWAFKLHGGRYQTAGLPDILCVCNGRVTFLEVKQPGGRVSEIQDFVHRKLERAGVKVHVVESVEQAIAIVERVERCAEADRRGQGEYIIQLLERWRDHCEHLAKSEIIPNTNERILHEAQCADHAVRIARGAMRTLAKEAKP